MIRFTTIIVFAFAFFRLQAQEEDKDTLNFDKETIIKSSSDAACDCIEKISTSKKEKDKVKEVSKCINDQVTSYQLMDKILTLF